MDLSSESLRQLEQEARQAQLPLTVLLDRLLPPAAPAPDPIARLAAFAAEERFTLGEELRLRDLWTA